MRNVDAEPAEIVSSAPSKLIVVEGNPIYLWCRTTGTPRPTVQWELWQPTSMTTLWQSYADGKSSRGGQRSMVPTGPSGPSGPMGPTGPIGPMGPMRPMEKRQGGSMFSEMRHLCTQEASRCRIDLMPEGGSVLRLNWVLPTDAGTYTCRATDEIHRVTRTHNVSLLGIIPFLPSFLPSFLPFLPFLSKFTLFSRNSHFSLEIHTFLSSLLFRRTLFSLQFSTLIFHQRSKFSSVALLLHLLLDFLFVYTGLVILISQCLFCKAKSPLKIFIV